MNPLLLLFMCAAVFVAAAFIIARRRNRVAPHDRLPTIIYLTQLIGVTAAGWATVVAVLTAPLVFQRRTGVHATTAIAPFSPWSAMTPKSTETGAYLFFAQFEQFRITVAQADILTQILQASGGIVTALPPIALGIFVAILCERIIRRAPFALRLVRLSWIGAGIFLFAGFAGQLLSGYASFRLANIAIGLIKAESPGAQTPTAIWPGTLELWPLWGALALGVLAVLIRHGATLQRDTEGLV